MADPVVSTLASGSASTATVTPTFSAQAAGTLLILSVSSDDYRVGTGSNRPESSGWTSLFNPTVGAEDQPNGQHFLGAYLWAKYATGSETSVSYTINSAAASSYAVIAATNIDTSVAISSVTKSILHGHGATTTGTTAITPTSGSRWLVVSSLNGMNASAGITGIGALSNSYTTQVTRAQGASPNETVSLGYLTLNGGTSTSTSGTWTGASAQCSYGILAAFKVSSGAATPAGTASGTFAYVGTAAGQSDRNGAATGTLVYVGTASGSSTRSGSAAGTLAYAGSAVGSTTRSGTASGTFAYAGAATGSATPQGTASGAMAYTGSATGTSSREGTASGTFAYSGSASGTAPIIGVNQGSASGSLTYTGTASGSSSRSGTAVGVVAYAGSASGTAPTIGAATGSAAGTLTYIGLATGSTIKSGTAAGAVAYIGEAAGATSRAGTAIGAYAYVGTAVGIGDEAIPEIAPDARGYLVPPDQRGLRATDVRGIAIPAEQRGLRVRPA